MHLSQAFQINSKCRRAESFEACCQWALPCESILSYYLPWHHNNNINKSKTRHSVELPLKTAHNVTTSKLVLTNMQV